LMIKRERIEDCEAAWMILGIKESPGRSDFAAKLPQLGKPRLCRYREQSEAGTKRILRKSFRLSLWPIQAAM
jgi:hypothetical protein